MSCLVHDLGRDVFAKMRTASGHSARNSKDEIKTRGGSLAFLLEVVGGFLATKAYEELLDLCWEPLVQGPNGGESLWTLASQNQAARHAQDRRRRPNREKSRESGAQEAPNPRCPVPIAKALTAVFEGDFVGDIFRAVVNIELIPLNTAAALAKAERVKKRWWETLKTDSRSSSDLDQLAIRVLNDFLVKQAKQAKQQTRGLLRSREPRSITPDPARDARGSLNDTHGDDACPNSRSVYTVAKLARDSTGCLVGPGLSKARCPDFPDALEN